MIKRKKGIKLASALLALSLLMSGCSGSNSGEQETSADTSASSVTDDEEDISIYTGSVVDNEEDLAIFKFAADVPDGFEAVIDSSEGKQYVNSELTASIIVKAQNYKDEFSELSIFADQGCAAIKLSNMLYQADTDFSDPVDTTVAGFDAIRYDYTVTAYIFLYETDENGENILDDEGNPIITDEKEVLEEYSNRVYYFYSEEDVFYIICEVTKDKAEEAQPYFDEFISSVSVSKAQ